MIKGKWIGAALGWMAGGPLGALAGLALGALFDKMGEGDGSFETQGQGSASYNDAGERNGFLFSLLVLSSYIIKADGKVMHSEMEVVRRFLRQNFGEVAVAEGEQILHRLFDEQNRQGAMAFRGTVSRCCAQIAAHMDYGQRLQLLNYLVIVAQADGKLPAEEVGALQDCARWLGLTEADLNSMLNLRSDSLEDAYKVLGVAPTATDDEVRRAYRKLALQHHPDRVATLGEDIRRAAEKKLQEINEAKERVFKARGMR